LIEKERCYFVTYFRKNNETPVLGQVQVNDEFGKKYKEKFYYVDYLMKNIFISMRDNADKKAYLRVFLKYAFIYGRSSHQRESTLYNIK